MDNEHPVLDYAPPPRSIRRVMTDSTAKALRYAGWFAWRRPLRAHELFLGGWLLVAIAWVAQALECQWHHYVFTPITVRTPFASAIMIVALAALTRVVVKRQWLLILMCMSIAVPTGVASGMLQYERCPHATYLQVFGVSIPVSGKACSNPRHDEPWWLRE